MNRSIRHHHACTDCGTKTPCSGTLEDNYDGEPPITCDDFHLSNGTLNPDWVCDRCQGVRDDRVNAEAERLVG